MTGELRLDALNGGLGGVGKGRLEAGLDGVAAAPFLAGKIGAGSVWACAPPAFGVAAFAMVQAHERGQCSRVRLHGGTGIEGGYDFVVVNVFQDTERGGSVGAVQSAEQCVHRL